MENKISTQPYKGTRDFYPEDMQVQNYIFNAMKHICRLYGYEEYNGPLLESFDLYAAKSGEEIVNNELYSFEDRGQRKVAIRPEMTPTVARMIAARQQELPKPARWFSIPNLWRYESPQRGRLREHWQLNVDVFGINTIDAEKEIIRISCEIMQNLGAKSDMYQVKINNRKLTDNLFKELDLQDDQKHRVGKLVDKKAKIDEDVFIKGLKDAGLNEGQIAQLDVYLKSSAESLETLSKTNEDAKATLDLINSLSDLGNVVFDPTLMRGFDYYTGVVFEIFDMNPLNNRSLFGGGRYDDLLSIFGREKVPAFGFGMGDVTVKDFLEVHGLLPVLESDTKVLVTVFSDETKAHSEVIANEFRRNNINTALGIGKLDKQFKYADQRRIKYAVILGPEEIANEKVKIKNLQTREEQSVSLEEAIDMMKN